MSDKTIGALTDEAECHGVVHYKGWTLQYLGSIDVSHWEKEP
jgi:hypothetical protein